MSDGRAFGKTFTSIWCDADWLRLSTDAQWLYQYLLSQPDISTCGVMPLMPQRWSKGSCDMSLERVTTAAKELAAQRFVVIDGETFEVLIRSYIRHDVTSLKNWKMLKGAVRATLRVRSAKLRRALLAECHRLDPLPEGTAAIIAELADGISKVAADVDGDKDLDADVDVDIDRGDRFSFDSESDRFSFDSASIQLRFRIDCLSMRHRLNRRPTTTNHRPTPSPTPRPPPSWLRLSATSATATTDERRPARLAMGPHRVRRLPVPSRLPLRVLPKHGRRPAPPTAQVPSVRHPPRTP